MIATAERAQGGVTIQRQGRFAQLPGDEDLRRLVAAALVGLDQPVLNLRIVDEAEGRALNRRWRGADQATNVLSFPARLPPGTGIELLGDVVLCAPVVEREAAAQGKTVAAHLAHLIVHGVLHLRGFDHTSAAQAADMEAEEIRILARLGIENPYLIDEH